jgi:hypothetical protein
MFFFFFFFFFFLTFYFLLFISFLFFFVFPLRPNFYTLAHYIVVCTMMRVLGDNGEVQARLRGVWR